MENTRSVWPQNTAVVPTQDLKFNLQKYGFLSIPNINILFKMSKNKDPRKFILNSNE